VNSDYLVEIRTVESGTVGSSAPEDILTVEDVVLLEDCRECGEVALETKVMLSMPAAAIRRRASATASEDRSMPSTRRSAQP